MKSPLSRNIAEVKLQPIAYVHSMDAVCEICLDVGLPAEHHITPKRLVVPDYDPTNHLQRRPALPSFLGTPRPTIC